MFTKRSIASYVLIVLHSFVCIFFKTTFTLNFKGDLHLRL